MFDLFRSDRPTSGIVFFRGDRPPAAEEFEALSRQRIDVEPLRVDDDTHWGLRLRHPAWGTAEVFCPKEQSPPIPHLEFIPNVGPSERQALSASRIGVLVKVAAAQQTVLRDRKRLLRFLSAIMGTRGAGAADMQSSLIWTRRMLDDELVHDAELDVEALYSIHAVRSERDPADKGRRCAWWHTHGLAELGAFDFDILNPSDDALSGSDIGRSLAFAIVEGQLKPDTDQFRLVHPNGDVRMVPVAEFMRSAPPQLSEIRRMDDDSHEHNRSIVCEPAARGLRAMLSRRAARPSVFLSGPFPEQMMVSFTRAATELMAQRARETAGVFERLAGELAAFDLPLIAKMGYPVDGGGGEREHMWFEVHGFRHGGKDGGVAAFDATLVNQPFAIASMQKGQRDWRPLEMLTDWAIVTPAGHITPRSMSALHRLRQDERLQKALRDRASEASISSPQTSKPGS